MDSEKALLSSRLVAPEPDSEERLYHYTKATSLLQILEKPSFMLGPLSRTNDPNENREWNTELFFSSSHHGSTDVDLTELNTTHLTIDRLLRRNVCVGCFAVDRQPPRPSDGSGELFHKGWARARMWDQYAENHTGACLVFSRDEFLLNVESESRASKENRERSFGKVSYFDKRRQLGMALNHLRERGLSEAIEDLRCQQWAPNSLYYWKNTDWSSEEEYRVVVVRSKPGRGQDDQPIFVECGSSLEAVILGEGFKGKLAVSLLATRLGIPIYQCVWSQGAPGLEIVTVQ